MNQYAAACDMQVLGRYGHTRVTLRYMLARAATYAGGADKDLSIERVLRHGY